MLLYLGDSLGLQLLIFVGMVIFFLAFSVLFLRLFSKLYELLTRHTFAASRPIGNEQSHGFLLKLNYYRALSSMGQQKFLRRLNTMLHRVQFSKEGPVNIDDEKEILIAAAAVQITFGLKEYDIDTIEHIKVFADDIFNPRTKARYKGLTFMNGNMFLSWKHFLEGMKYHDDGINLGLHETAHGLYIMFKEYRAYDDFDKILEAWYAAAKHEVSEGDSDEHHFFRNYASANVQEFFAILIENFFERPDLFRKKLPWLYRQLSVLLNQDPLNPNDFAVSDWVHDPSDLITERLYLHKNRPHPTQGLILWASGISVVTMVFLKSMFLETLFNLLLYSIPCMVLSYNVFKRFYLDSKRMTRKWYFVFCFAGINPVVFVFFMLLNLLVSSGIHGEKEYLVKGMEYYNFGLSQNDLALLDNGGKLYTLEHNYNVPIELRLIDKKKNMPFAVKYKYHYGITGLKVVDNVELKYE